MKYMNIYLNQYDNNKKIVGSKDITDIKRGERFDFNGGKFELVVHKEINSKGFMTFEYSLSCIEGFAKNITISFQKKYDNWSKDNYIFMPAAVYNANRFEVIKKAYPPSISRKEFEEEIIDYPYITDIPHLSKNKDNSKIELLSGDMATPCFGYHDQTNKKDELIFISHNTEKGYTGFKFEEFSNSALLIVEAPCVREHMYMNMKSDNLSDDIPANIEKGQKISIEIAYSSFDCNNIIEFYKKYAINRKTINEDRSKKEDISFEQAFRIIEEKYQKEQWNEKFGYYMVAPKKMGIFSDWQAGWVGGGINSYAFMRDGNSMSRKRANESLDSICDTLMNENGFAYSVFYEGEKYGDDFENKEDTNYALVRKNADLLLFFGKHLLSLKENGEKIKDKYLKKIISMGNSFVKIFEKYGQWGQYIDIKTCEIIIPKSLSSSTLAGGLTLLYKLTGDKKYINTAKAAGEYYYNNYVSRGLTNGGPGEILQCPDSESCFGILESFILLYQYTKEEKWLEYATAAADQCSSWVMTYNFQFPKETEFNRLKIKTLGSVFANVQNKHSAPGICTLSGDSLLKLYFYTKKQRHLELIKDISHHITEYLSTKEKPIHTWDGRVLKPGWMSERVNTSDWETKANIGGVFYGSCWCEVSCLLTYNEIPGVLYEISNEKITVFDQVKAYAENNNIIIENCKRQSIKVKVMITNDKEEIKFLENGSFKMKEYYIEANSKIKIPF